MKTLNNKSRFKEITEVLHKHEITKGVSPEKLRLILEDLGPTYIKLGQIMSTHSDILPQKYCDELMRLRSNVAPMEFTQVEEVIEEELGDNWKDIFSFIDQEPLGAASIAQVHRARLTTGEDVVIKVQRKGIYEVMAKDISLLHKAVKLLPPISIKDMVDLDMVLDEMWDVTQQEMNFLLEASNIEEFHLLNQKILYVGVPKLFKKYTTSHVLVMEYIEGCAIDDKEVLSKEGYDLEEVGTKLVDHFMKQVMDDGYFHADPHPGNVKVRDGKIIWIDMGMMGRLSDRDRDLIRDAIQGVAANDIGMIQDAVLALGEFRGKPNQGKLYEDISGLMARFGDVDMGNIDIAEVMMSLMEVMKANKITMPHGLTMLARGLTHMEGVLAVICPSISITQIAANHMKANYFDKGFWKKELHTSGKKLYRSLYKGMDIPSLASDLMKGIMKGQTRINLDLQVTEDFSKLLRHLIRNIVMGLWVMALLISSSIICTTNMHPKILGIPALGAIGYLFALVIVIYNFVKHMFNRK